MRKAIGLAIFALLLNGCDQFASDTPRAAWERAMHAYAQHDFGALWDTMSDDSRQDTIRVLTHVKRDPKYREAMRVKFQIPPAELDRMSPREFFIALMTAVERSQPKMTELRAEVGRTAAFSRQEINGDRAVVYWESPAGGAENMMFVKEGKVWKPVIKR